MGSFTISTICFVDCQKLLISWAHIQIPFRIFSGNNKIQFELKTNTRFIAETDCLILMNKMINDYRDE